MPVEYGNFGEPIPDNLKFLNAARIRPGEYNIVLAGCLDEFIRLDFARHEFEIPSITLSWAAPTEESSYAVGMRVLWSESK